MPFGIGEIIKLVLFILGFLMNRANVRMEAKKDFYEFIEKMSGYGLAPARLKKSYEKQLKELEDRVNME